MKKKASIFCVLSLGCAVGTAQAADYRWQPSVLSGFWNDPASWVAGQCPTEVDRAQFGDNLTEGQSYTVKIATEGQTDGVATQVHDPKPGTKVTFDATGTTWKKVRTSDKWTEGQILRFDNADHIFNIESVDSGKVNDQYGFTLTDGKISYRAATADEGDRLTFESGVFNDHEIDGNVTPHTTILMYSVHEKESRVVFAEGSEAHLHSTEIRGQAEGGEVVVDGGDVHFYNGLRIKTYGTSAEGVLRVSAGKATIEEGGMWLGGNDKGAGRLIIDGEGRFEHKGDVVYFPDVVDSVGYLVVTNSGVYHSDSANIAAGHKTNSKAYITVSGQGRIEMLAKDRNMNLAEGEDYSYGSLKVKGEGYVGVNALSGANGGTGRQAEVVLEDNGHLELLGGSALSGGTDAVVNFTMKDDARLTLNSDIRFGNNNSAMTQVQFLGGTIDGDMRPKDDGTFGGATLDFRGAPGSAAVFDGVDATVRNLVIEGPQNNPAYTNTVVLKSGSLKIRVNGMPESGNGLDIRGNDRNSMFLVEGGELTVGTPDQGMVRIGHNGANNGYHAVYRQTGGVANLVGVVNLCDCAGGDGEIELLGGTTRAREIRGWNGCETRGSTGKATLYANGGTLEPWQDGRNFMYTMSSVTVGEKGLTIDTKNYNNVRMHVKINDADGAEGLFVKTGTGTLKVGLTETDEKAVGVFAGRNLNSTHTFTRIDEGTLLLEDQEEATFGKNVTVKGGATLSLEGTTVTTLTVDTLTLGDGHGFAVLKLDEGDTVIINGENGITATCGAIDVPWFEENGAHPVFVCANGVTVDEEELNKITVYQANAEKDYRWEAETAEDGETTIWSMVVSDHSEDTSKSLTYNADGTVSTNGTGYVAKLTAATGAAIESGDVVLARTAEVNVGAGASLALNGSIIGTGSEFKKTGSGKLTLEGDNSEFYGSLVSQGGLLEVTERAALGPADLYFPLVLGNGTFKYSGEPVTYLAPLKLAGDEAGKSVILENDCDMTFPSIEHVRGTFVKKGIGALMLELGEGKYMMGHDSVDGDYGENKGAIEFPESGDAPDKKDGLYGVTIAEGALKVKGQGVGKTTLATDNTALLATGYAAKAAPVLEVVDARVEFGKAGRHATFVQAYPMPSEETPVPEVRLTNAWLQVNSPVLGNDTVPIGKTGPIVTMKDSTFFGEYSCMVGAAGYTSPIIDADDSVLTTDGLYGWEIAAANIQADFHGMNAVFGSINKTTEAKDINNRTGRITCQDHPKGTVTIRDGARLQTTRGIRFTGGQINLVFDGGIFEILPYEKVEEQRNGESTWTRNDRSITVANNGLEIAICEGSVHTFKVPLAGEGKIVKTGLGTLSFARDEQRDASEKLLQATNLFEIAEGTLETDGELITEQAQIKVDAGATLALGGTTMQVASLEVVAGATVTNANVTTAVLKLAAGSVPTFTETTFNFAEKYGIEIDFGEAGPDFTRTPFAVAKFVDGEGNPLKSLSVAAWRGMAKGYTPETLGKEGSLGGDYRFTYDPETGTVYATYSAKSRFYITIR